MKVLLTRFRKVASLILTLDKNISLQSIASVIRLKVSSKKGHGALNIIKSLKNVVNSLTSRVKPWVIQSFLTFGSMDRTP